MRPIDADAVLLVLNKLKIPFNADINAVIMNTPTVDAVEVVRCKDCKQWDRFPICSAFPHFHECHEWNERISTRENDYCSKGVRKDD